MPELVVLVDPLAAVADNASNSPLFNNDYKIKHRILLVAPTGSYRIAAYLQAAMAMEQDILVASPGEHSFISEIQDGLHIDFDNFESSLITVQQQHKKFPFTGVIGTEDTAVEFSTYVATQLDLIHNPTLSVQLTHRKDLARQRLTEHQCTVPQYSLLDINQALEPQLNSLTWPYVIKPLNMSASRGVIRVNNMQEAIIACQRVMKIITADNIEKETFENTHLLLEQYIDGHEVAFEGFLHNDKLHRLALFDKPNPLVGPYFEETIYVTPSSLSHNIQQHIHHRVAQACQAYGLITGPIHAELRIDSEGEAWILEVANRTIGGDCARTLDVCGEYALEKLTISLATGNVVIPKMMSRASGVMMIPIKQGGILQKVSGIAQARNVQGITDIKINISPGNTLLPLPEGNQYLGYIFAQATTSEQVTSALNNAYAKLDFKVTKLFELTPQE